MTTTVPVGSPLSALDEDQRYQRFDVLQQRMAGVWDLMAQDQEGESVVVVPSVSLEVVAGGSGTLAEAFEERLLFLLLLLRQPRLRMIYVTSMPIAPAIIEYYLALLPGVIPSHARSRLTLLSVNDSSQRPLTEKLLSRPRLLRRIAALIPDHSKSHLVPYITTPQERDVALALDIPMYGADPRLFHFGTKSGCRRLFREEGVRCPDGVEDLYSLDELVDATLRLRARRPETVQVVVKLNEGVSGRGNAVVDLSGVPPPGAPDERAVVVDRFRAMRLEAPDTPLAVYLDALSVRGGIVEERVTGTDLRSPSVQLRVTPHGEVELLSTHDQLLGGASGQSYLGCVFPADVSYAPQISAAASTIGARLLREGVLGRFAIDFLTVRAPDGGWTSYAIEINLRKGGTTHPFLTLQFLTGGHYDAASGIFVTATGAEKHLVATDHLESPLLRGLGVDDVFDIVACHRLHFDQSRQSGVVFHMISSLTELGRIGLTAVGDTAEQAHAIYQDAERIMLEEAQGSLREEGLPAL